MAPIYVFTGPTLSAEQVRSELDAVVLGPVAQGDVYAVTREQPWGIGIIDGYFERVPAVWHKEILWAMAQGVHVFGAASMGALRAAELERFGMEGVGEIFAAYTRGELEDDDEVTVVHGSGETGYIVLSEAMVNIRQTLAAAAAVISPAARSALVDLAKATHYRQRTWPKLLADAAAHGLPAAELDALAAWLPAGRVDQKRVDALAMLRAMRERAASDPARKEVRFTFQNTDAWEQVRRQIDRRPLDTGAGADTYLVGAVTDELRLDPDRFAAEWARALVRALARELSPAVDTERAAFEATVAGFCREHGLDDAEQLERWLVEQHLQPEEFTRLLEEETRIGRTLGRLAGEVLRQLPAVLRLRGTYAALARRARAKAAALASRGLETPGLADAGLSEDRLWHWYFVERLQRTVPDDLDAHARQCRFASIDAMQQAVLREHLFVHDPSASAAGTD